jgi:hypothetical protein
MTDRVKGFTVTLDRDIRIDDVEQIQKALEMVKGVLHVEPSISTSEDHMAMMRINSNIRSKLYKFINEEL